MPVLFCEVAYSAWNDHVLGWWKHKDDPNVLFLKYEDLHKVMFSYNNNSITLSSVASLISACRRLNPDDYVRGWREVKTRQYLIFIFISFSGSTREEFGRGILLWTRLDFRGGTPYNCLYGEAPLERGAFLHVRYVKG